MITVRTSRDTLLDPLPTEVFFSEYWETQPLHISRTETGNFSHLLGLAEIESLLSCNDLYFPDVMVTQSGKTIASRDYTDDNNRVLPYRLLEQHAQGATVVISLAHTRFAALAALCRELNAEFGMRCQANVYLSPPGRQGFNPHFDSHDVFILQVSGKKTFNFYESNTTLPLTGDKFDSTRHTAGSKTEQIELGAGDTLYIPRGVMHDAVADDSDSSLHITVGLFSVSWLDLLSACADSAASRDSALRRSIPWELWSGQRAVTDRDLEYVQDMFASSLHTADVNNVLSDLQDEAALGASADCGGMLNEIQRLHLLTRESVLVVRDHVAMQVTAEDDIVKLRCGGQILEFGGALGAAVTQLVQRRCLAIGELKGLDDEQKLALGRQLIGSGITRVE